MGILIKWIFVCFLGWAVNANAHLTGTFHDANGQLIQASALKNKWLIINYWADWCDSCLEEIPELNRFYEHNTNKNIVILGVNYDQMSKDSLKASIHKTGIKFPVLLEDPGLSWQLGEVTVLPTTFIVNPQGDIVKKIIGPNTEQSLLKVIYYQLVQGNKKNEVTKV